MKINARAVRGVSPLPPGESASVPATATDNARYLFALPQFKEDGAYEKDLLPPTTHAFTLKGIRKPATINLLADGAPLEYDLDRQHPHRPTARATTHQARGRCRSGFVEAEVERRSFKPQTSSFGFPSLSINFGPPQMQVHAQRLPKRCVLVGPAQRRVNTINNFHLSPRPAKHPIVCHTNDGPHA